MIRSMLVLTLSVLASLALWSFAATGASTARAAESGDKEATTDETTGGDSDGTTTTSDDGEKKESNVTFFPGVRGISGKELERIIREREARKKEEERKQRRYAPARTETSDPAPKPAEPERPRETPKPTPAAKETPAETTAESDEPKLKGVELSDEARDFLKRLRLMTLRAEFLLEKADEIRVDAAKEASAVGNEALIQYIIRYTNRSTKETRAFEAALKLPLLVYQYVYEQAVAGLSFNKSQRPVDLPAPAAAVADDCVARLRTVWMRTLLASAEIYTRLRQISAAEAIYNALVKEYPKDEVIAKSYKAFVAVRDAEKPNTPPGVPTSGGDSRRHYEPKDDTEDTGDGDKVDPYTKKYLR